MDGSVNAVNIDSYSDHSKSYDPEIPVKFFAPQSCPELPEDYQVVQVKVDAEEDHKDSYNNLNILAVIEGDACSVIGKSTCTCCSEYIYEAVKS